MAHRLSPAQASIVGAALLANAAAGCALVLLDERMGTAHLSAPEMRAWRAVKLPATLRIAGERVMHLLHPAAPSPAATPASTTIPAPAPDDAPDEAGATATSPDNFNRIAPPAYLAGPHSPTISDRRFVIRRILPIDGPIRYGEWHWDEAGVPPGPLVITVDLKARVISAFRSGYEIGTAAVLLGTGRYPTPTGVFPISQKDAHHISNLYDAPMPWMLRLTADGVTIHGANVENGFASHGCIGVPEAFARLLFSHARLGDRVYITRGKQVGLGDSLIDE